MLNKVKSRMAGNKTKFLILTVLLSLGFLSQKVHADNFSLTIAISEGETGKDSWSSNTSINIMGNNLSYSKSFGGSIKKKNDLIDKNCSLTNEQVSAIQTMIRNNNLLTSETIGDEFTERKNPSHFISISGDILLGERTGRLRISGETGMIGDKDLYKNSYELISLIEKYVEECK